MSIRGDIGLAASFPIAGFMPGSVMLPLNRKSSPIKIGRSPHFLEVREEAGKRGGNLQGRLTRLSLNPPWVRLVNWVKKEWREFGIMFLKPIGFSMGYCLVPVSEFRVPQGLEENALQDFGGFYRSNPFLLDSLSIHRCIVGSQE
jgi:hypothetical protein